MLVFLFFNYFLLMFGTYITFRKMTNHGASSEKPFADFPVTVLKPLKGIDSCLEENLESFFLLDYPKFELLLSVANIEDAAVPTVRKLMAKFPQTPARLVLSDEVIGINPKVNNLLRPYEEASYDLIWIVDSNVRIQPDYLKRVVSELNDKVGVVTGIVGGQAPEQWGGELEAVFLNSFYARAINQAYFFGTPCVSGKSLLFRKSQLEISGGMRALGDFINEDHQIGEKIRKLGLEIVMAPTAIPQNIGRYSFRSFWQRHVRWSVIRKAMAPGVYLCDPLMASVPLGILGALSFHDVSHSLKFLAFHFSFWFLNDLLVSTRMTKSISYRYPIAWIAREVLNFPLWVTAIFSNTVDWRGTPLKIGKGGRFCFTPGKMPAHSRWKTSYGKEEWKKMQELIESGKLDSINQPKQATF